MARIALAFDPSASMSKGMYAVTEAAINTAQPPKWMVMEPEVVESTQAEIEAYEQQKIGQSQPENEAWLTLGKQHYAVGYLARSQFNGWERHRELKYELAVYKVLAMVGAIATQYHLSNQCRLDLGLLLPYGEYEDRSRFERLLREALLQFSFRGRPFWIELESLICLPEGGGLIVRGLTKDPKQHSALVLMVGYRNVSYLRQERGQIVEGQTANLGFLQLLEKICQMTSGYTPVQLIEPVFQAGATVERKILKPLIRSRHPLAQKSELNELVAAVKAARKTHYNNLITWLESRRLPQVDEVVLSGGTAHYYRSELSEYFPRGHWAEYLEQDLQKRVLAEAYRYRLTDLYGFWFYLNHQIRRAALSV